MLHSIQKMPSKYYDITMKQYSFSVDMSSLLIIILVVAIIVMIQRGLVSKLCEPSGYILWFIGPILGLLTIALPCIGCGMDGIGLLFSNLHTKKLADLYLLAVVTSAAGTADAFELAYRLHSAANAENKRNSTAWVILFSANLVFLVCMAILSITQSSCTKISAKHIIPSYYIWYFLAFSVVSGAIFRRRLEAEKNYM
jgi:hypothetical protein